MSFLLQTEYLPEFKGGNHFTRTERTQWSIMIWCAKEPHLVIFRFAQVAPIAVWLHRYRDVCYPQPSITGESDHHYALHTLHSLTAQTGINRIISHSQISKKCAKFIWYLLMRMNDHPKKKKSPYELLTYMVPEKCHAVYNPWEWLKRRTSY